MWVTLSGSHRSNPRQLELGTAITSIGNAWRNRLLTSTQIRRDCVRIPPEDTCRKNRGSDTSRGPIYSPPGQFLPAYVVEIVDVASSKKQRVGSSKNAKLLKPKINCMGYRPEIHFVQGGWQRAAKVACFQVLVVSGVVGSLLNPVEPC
jgi:hypothetical protein